MRKVVVVAGIVAVVAGGAVVVLALSGDGAEGRSDVAHIVCETDGASADATEVRPRTDGVHFSVSNPARAGTLEVRPADDPIAATQSIQLSPSGATDATFQLAPGRIVVACVPAGSAFTGRTAELAVRDDTGLWISPELPCATTKRLTFETFYFDEAPDETARRAVGGIVETDVLVKPGYPGTQWHGDLIVVERDGEAIATVVRGQNQGVWSVSIDACPGNHLTDGLA